jgi:2,4-dienoyl-CoA reductase-like NADH-dependent reductase (Old Yellow Enzyme family)/thioredoxin reductase
MSAPQLETTGLFEPLRLGPLTLRNRIMMPPHGLAVGNPFGTEAEMQRGAAYWGSRAADGVALVCGMNGFIDNSVLIPGFDPSGLGARKVGVFRLPNFREGAQRYVKAIHEGGAYAGIQLIMQGGLPHSPSGVLANYANNQVPHTLSKAEIRWFIEEYRFSAREARAAGMDVVELHANHEDLLELFLSPATNHRTDEYGGDLAGRMRFILEVLAAVREETGPDMAIGVRMNMDELFEGGYDAVGGIEIAQVLDGSNLIDYLHCVMGNNWGAPSYIQPHNYAPGQWAPLAGAVKAAVNVPVIYTGRVSTPETAAGIIRRGEADAVGIARAMFADPFFVSKTKSGNTAQIRPCIGTNDCLHRSVVDGIGFGCSVNPGTGHNLEAELPTASKARRVLVVGAGPAGLELAASLAERGHSVTLWEAESTVGGQMRVAAMARENGAYADFLDFQQLRLKNLGVELQLNHQATLENIRAARADVIALATGASSRRPNIPGIDQEHVLDGRQVMLGKVDAGHRVAVIAMEDHMQPLTIAGFLADQGKDVTIFYPTPAVAPLVGKYSIGAPLAKLAAAEATVNVLERVVEIDGDEIRTRNIYSGTERKHAGFDSVVTACGGVPETSLFVSLQADGVEVHVLGDAYAPRRISFATRQAYALASAI